MSGARHLAETARQVFEQAGERGELDVGMAQQERLKSKGADAMVEAGIPTFIDTKIVIAHDKGVGH